MLTSGINICDLNTVRSMDLSQYAGIITIEEPDTDDPIRTTSVAQLVLQFHDIVETMLGYVEPELEHIRKALFFAREIDGRLLVHCRAGVSRSTAIALAIAVERFGIGNEKQACEWLFHSRPQAEPDKLLVYLVEELFNCQGTLSGVASPSLRQSISCIPRQTWRSAVTLPQTIPTVHTKMLAKGLYKPR